METLTPQRFAQGLAYIPGEGVCVSLFGNKACDFWSFRKSDALGFTEEKRLRQMHLSSKRINDTLITLSAKKAFANPFQYTLLTFLEGIKCFFWESTKIGFVSYPTWLQKIYAIKILNDALRFTMAVLSIVAILRLGPYLLKPALSPIAFFIALLLFLYIGSFSFFFILTRYALPIAPLYLISIGMWINEILNPQNTK